MEIRDITGFYFMDYSEIYDSFEDKELEKYANRQKEKAALITKNWSKEKKIEWNLRNYSALKMILASTLMLNSAVYAHDKNLNIVVPYLLYYSLFNTSKALLLSDPTVPWNINRQQNLVTIAHSTSIKQVYESVRHLSPKVASKIKYVLEESKGLRELFSYKFPSVGLDGIENQRTMHSMNIYEIIDVCKLLAEIAQFNSEIMELSADKNIKKSIDISINDLESGFVFKGLVRSDYYNEPDEVIDEYDFRRMKYFLTWNPTNIISTAKDGILEDFFGSWYPENLTDEDFNPDENWGILLPI